MNKNKKYNTVSKKEYQYNKKYGITGKQYAEMARNQENRCAICHRLQLSEYKRYLSIDHDHTTGKIRGLLCNNCNSMLGFAGDNVEILQNAIRYLKGKK